MGNHPIMSKSGKPEVVSGLSSLIPAALKIPIFVLQIDLVGIKETRAMLVEVTNFKVHMFENIRPWKAGYNVTFVIPAMYG